MSNATTSQTASWARVMLSPGQNMWLPQPAVMPALKMASMKPSAHWYSVPWTSLN